MATKKQKREAAENKREEFLAKVEADGLAAQKADRERREKKTQMIRSEAQRVNDRHRRVLDGNGINPGTGVAYDKMTAQRVADDEQPPLNMSDYVGEREHYDDLIRPETGELIIQPGPIHPSPESEFMRFHEALRIGGFFRK